MILSGLYFKQSNFIFCGETHVMPVKKSNYIESKTMIREWMKIHHWDTLCACEPCDYTTVLGQISGDEGLEYMKNVLALSGCPSEPLGSMFKQIADNLTTSPCFMNYSFKEDMAGDALINMVRYADRYNPLKSKNIFSYFTKIAFNASIVRLKKEEKSRNIISKYQEENFHRLMMEQAEGKCNVHINPEHSIEESINQIEEEVQNEESNWD